MQFKFNIDDIKYIKILCQDRENNPKIVKAALRKVDDVNMYACAKLEQEINLKLPQDVSLNIVCKEGLYRTQTMLTKLEYDLPYTYFVIETPKGFEYQQNREYFRVMAEFPCNYIYKNEETTKEYKVQTCNISANGVTILLPELVISEEDCMLDIIIAGCSIELKAKYIRSEKDDTGYKVSFAYTNISNMDRDFISQVCIQKQLEEKRKYIS